MNAAKKRNLSTKSLRAITSFNLSLAPNQLGQTVTGCLYYYIYYMHYTIKVKTIFLGFETREK